MLTLLKLDALNLKLVLVQPLKIPQPTFQTFPYLNSKMSLLAPLQVTPLKRLKFEVPAYQSLVAHFKAVEKRDRNMLLLS